MGDEDTLPPGSQIPLGGESLEKAGDEIGPYKLISKIGEGGFGTVWVAERRSPFVQRVALKVIKAGMDSRAVIARFEQERQALAVMNHPNIAKVLDGGLTPSGRPYFAMEYVKGEHITAYCDNRKLSLKDRLSLFVQVCEAVQHAHMKGIIHRDLKPGNILIASGENDMPQAKVIDFGTAKALTQKMSEHTIFTETGQMIGTPSYMSPEQASPDANDIDTRTDVYSLGVILYELLSGVLPFEQRELRSKAYREIQRIIREDEPPTPSARLSTIATKDVARISLIEKTHGLRMQELVRDLRKELEWIPLKAMRKEPQNRYQSAMVMAEDIRNYLQGRPLVAAPVSAGYRIRKYINRNRGLVAAVGAVAMALVIGLGMAMWGWRQAELALLEIKRTTYFGSIQLASSANNAGDMPGLRRELRKIRELDLPGTTDGFAYRYLHAMAKPELAEFWHEDVVMRVDFSPDGHTLASSSDDKSIRLSARRSLALS